MRTSSLRRRALWEAIARGSQPTIGWIERTFHVSRATAKRDVEALRDLQCPLRYDSAVGGYVTDDPAWQLPSGEVEASTAGPEGALAGATARALMDAWSPALGATLRAEAGRDFERLVVVTTSRGADVDVALLTALCRAIREQQAVTFQFRSPWQAGDAAASPRLVSPWLLQLDDGHAYLRGYCHARRELRTFHVAGIEGLAPSNERWQRPPRDLRKRLAGRVGIGGDVAAVHEAHVRLHGPWAQWAARERWHPDQRDHWEGSVLVRRFRFGLAIEAARRLMPGASDVEVVGPPELREAFAGLVEAAWVRLQGR